MDRLDINLHGAAIVPGVLNAFDVAVVVAIPALEVPDRILRPAPTVQAVLHEFAYGIRTRARYSLKKYIERLVTGFATSHPIVSGALLDAVGLAGVFERHGARHIIGYGLDDLRGYLSWATALHGQTAAATASSTPAP